jgi:hypothetical protein
MLMKRPHPPLTPRQTVRSCARRLTTGMPDTRGDGLCGPGRGGAPPEDDDGNGDSRTSDIQGAVRVERVHSLAVRTARRTMVRGPLSSANRRRPDYTE